MEIFEIKSNLPPTVCTSVWIKNREGCLKYSSNGIISQATDCLADISQEDDSTEIKKGTFFQPIEEGILILRACIYIDVKEKVIFFYSKKEDAWRLNQYGELVSDRGYKNLDKTKILSPSGSLALNTLSVLTPWIISRMKKDGIFEGFVGIKMDEDFFLGMFRFYTNGMKHHIRELLDNGFRDETAELARRGMSIDVNKSVIETAKAVSKYKTNIPALIIANHLTKKHKINDIRNLLSFIRICGCSAFDWSTFLAMDMDIDLNGFNNYMVCQIFKGNDKPAYLSPATEWNIPQEINHFIASYRDYLRMAGDNAEAYPESLQEAHDEAVRRCNEYLAVETKKKQEETERKFRQAVEADHYQFLKHKVQKDKNSYEFTVPQTAEDLTTNGAEMNHCVAIYTQTVASGSCEIIIVKKNNKPYMTLEIRDEKIVQAKLKNNQIPQQEEDLRIINEYAAIKMLQVQSF